MPRTTQTPHQAFPGSGNDNAWIDDDAGDIREENPPDGPFEVVTEWREGKDKIIERRLGPGEDIQVEVIKDAYRDPRSPPTWDENLGKDMREAWCEFKKRCHLGLSTPSTPRVKDPIKRKSDVQKE